MDKLLALIAEISAEDEEDVVIRFLRATWSEMALELRLGVSVNYSEQVVWDIFCEDVFTYSLDDEGAFSLELTDDHPLLWEFKYESALAYFTGVPVDADAAVGALYQAHENSVGSWIRFGHHLNGAQDLSRLLAGGHGLLADAPIPLLALYKKTLAEHGVDVIWNRTYRSKPAGERHLQVLLMGSSYIVGEGWAAKEVSQPG
jgi:hypothetical protein